MDCEQENLIIDFKISTGPVSKTILQGDRSRMGILCPVSYNAGETEGNW